MDFTQEQNEIFKSNENIILIKAFAGSGKTTTLVEFAKRRPSSQFIYLAFNSSVVESAKYKFPRNVKVSTLHGIAYKELGSIYASKLEKPFKPLAVLNYLGFSRNSKSQIEISRLVVEIINNYTNSAYEKIDDAIPYHDKYTRQELLDYVETIWFAMLDNTNEFPCTHDTYLKLYQLSEPDLHYDYILFDEAQDANPVIVDLIMKQMSKGKTKLVVVGDSHQAIYAFRNAINSLNKFSHRDEFHLSKSFRFGSNIAHAANTILKSLKGEQIKLTGSSVEDAIVDKFEKDEKFTIISRTNSALFLKAIQSVDNNKKIHFVTGFSKYNFYKILDIDHLYYGRLNRIKDLHIKEYETYQNFSLLADTTMDKEMIFLKEIVNKYHGKIENLFEKIKESSVDDIRMADIVLTTAHKAKGLEFDNVFLCNDFAIFINDKGEINLRGWKEEEINILYVAVTRAIHKLKANTSLKYILKYYKDNNIGEKAATVISDGHSSSTGLSKLNKITNNLKSIK
jgi:superfamily I DNA/RNA helicase